MKNNRSIQRCLSILRAFADQPFPSLAELAAAVDLPRPTVLRFLCTLQEEGYVQKEAARWRLTPRVLEIGFAALQGAGMNEQIQAVLQNLADLCSGTANFGEGDHDRVVILGRALALEERRRLYVMNLRVGSALPRDKSALGMALALTPAEHSVLHYPEGNHISIAVPLPGTGPRQFALGISASITDWTEEKLNHEILPVLFEKARHIALLIQVGGD
ncbi:IclR family transcriptional regulator [Lacisediminimonas profundi]|uniref:IclR family transcriptional regulator n=1 Tax=Lacisediminimonas profundi TaxID=2603856 RepID=UPI00124B6517|nr:helix-turn-helix domain-containing protein [Lacisediminimonas profundi]